MGNFLPVFKLKSVMAYVKSNVLVVLCACSVLISCTADRIALNSDEHKTQIAQDADETQDKTIPQHIDLTAREAVEIGIYNNLDARVSALEVISKEDDIDLAKLQALPNVKLAGSYLGRNNKGASSSRSLNTGNQSLEPSFSTEQHRRTAELSANWNLLNVALVIGQARITKDEALIAKERHDKVLHNIQRDVYSAYWRAKAYQNTKNKTQNLIDQTKKHLDNIALASRQDLLSASEEARLKNGFMQQYRTLTALHNDLYLAEIELKSLLSLPQSTDINYVSTPENQKRQIRKLLGESVIELEQEALLSRPEMRETILQKNIDKQNVRNTVLQTIPGAELFLGANRDTNKFLADGDWLSYSATLTQNIISLFTLPVRKRAAENVETLGDARRVALAAAIMTQVHLARHRLQTSLDEYDDAKKSGAVATELARAENQRHKEGLSSLGDSLPIMLSAQTDRVRVLQAEADVHDALASLLNTLGRSLGNDPEDSS